MAISAWFLSIYVRRQEKNKRISLIHTKVHFEDNILEYGAAPMYSNSIWSHGAMREFKGKNKMPKQNVLHNLFFKKNINFPVRTLQTMWWAVPGSRPGGSEFRKDPLCCQDRIKVQPFPGKLSSSSCTWDRLIEDCFGVNAKKHNHITDWTGSRPFSH